jgi:phosphoglycerate-specific signal transduction histidine kinase
MAVKPARAKISTTIAHDNYAYLDSLVDSGKASNLAEALDKIVATYRRFARRIELEKETAGYFNRLPEKAAREESELAEASHKLTHTLDFDREL